MSQTSHQNLHVKDLIFSVVAQVFVVVISNFDDSPAADDVAVALAVADDVELLVVDDNFDEVDVGTAEIKIELVTLFEEENHNFLGLL